MSAIRFLNAGESHGPELTTIVDGLPAGLPVDVPAIDAELARRQRGFGSGGRMKIERDRALITSGVMAGRTTGGPIAVRIANRDWDNWRDRDIPPMTTPRPGHADLVGAIKHGHRDLRLSLERASARETATRVAVGALCKQLLATFDIWVGGYVVAIGSSSCSPPVAHDPDAIRALARVALDNDLACPVAAVYDAMHREVEAAMKARDTLGGVLEVVAIGLPPGLGSYAHWDRRLDGLIAQAMLSIQAMKGVEIGPAFTNATLRGTAVHDAIKRDDRGQLRRDTNRAGGLEGGVTNGAPLVVRVAMKPLSTTLTPLRSVDLATGDATDTTYERSDFCAVPRAVPIAEAMLALVLANALVDKLGGDSIDEMRPRYDALRRATIADLAMTNQPIRFDLDSGSDRD